VQFPLLSQISFVHSFPSSLHVVPAAIEHTAWWLLEHTIGEPLHSGQEIGFAAQTLLQHMPVLLLQPIPSAFPTHSLQSESLPSVRLSPSLSTLSVQFISLQMGVQAVHAPRPEQVFWHEPLAPAPQLLVPQAVPVSIVFPHALLLQVGLPHTPYVSGHSVQEAGCVHCPAELQDRDVQSWVPLQVFCVAQIVPDGFNGCVQTPKPLQVSYVQALLSSVHAVPVGW
jgi:hypothetical protein